MIAEREQWYADHFEIGTIVRRPDRCTIRITSLREPTIGGHVYATGDCLDRETLLPTGGINFHTGPLCLCTIVDLNPQSPGWLRSAWWDARALFARMAVIAYADGHTETAIQYMWKSIRAGQRHRIASGHAGRWPNMEARDEERLERLGRLRSRARRGAA